MSNAWDVIRRRCQAAGSDFHAADNVAMEIADGELEEIEAAAAEKVRELLEILVVDVDGDPNARETPARVARMLVREVMAGRFQRQPKATDFPNERNLDELVLVGPVSVRSTCSHHLVPILGRAWVGVIPSTRVLGLSKFARLAEWVMARPQVQEGATVQLADLLERILEPKGLGVVVRATHLCMTWRGVRDGTAEMTTSVMRGAFRDNASARAELLSLVR